MMLTEGFNTFPNVLAQMYPGFQFEIIKDKLTKGYIITIKKDLERYIIPALITTRTWKTFEKIIAEGVKEFNRKYE